jgi:chromosome segregation ATPase
MANTEIRTTLRYVREAENEVANALDKSGLPKQQRNLLGDVADSLRELDDLLVTIDLNESIDDLAEKSKEMQAINKQVQKKIGDLKKVAQTIDAVAKAVDALVKAFGLLAAAGLV